MKLGRLWQPQRGLFWLMLAFNAFSSVGSFVARNWTLNTAGLLLVIGLSLINIGGGLWAAWKLVKEPAPGEKG